MSGVPDEESVQQVMMVCSVSRERAVEALKVSGCADNERSARCGWVERVHCSLSCSSWEASLDLCKIP